MKILLSGSSGFVGSNLIKYLESYCFLITNISKKDITLHNFNSVKSAEVIIHLSGKAHDIKNVSNPQEYYEVNTEFTKRIFDEFLKSNAKVFITLSSVKAVADEVEGILTEEVIPNPITHYGKSKLLAEEYIMSQEIPKDKRIYILRPTMIHGSGNKGNLNSLYKMVSKGIPWPLGAFDNQRSFCSIDNLLFVIQELIEQENIPSGVYNICDDEPISTNELVELISSSLKIRPKMWHLSKGVVKGLARIGDVFHLPLNTERLDKLTESYVVSNKKLLSVLGKPLTVSSREGLFKTFESFKQAN